MTKKVNPSFFSYEFDITVFDVDEVHGKILHKSDESRAGWTTEDRGDWPFTSEGCRWRNYIKLITVVDMADFVLAGTFERMLVLLCWLTLVVHDIRLQLI